MVLVDEREGSCELIPLLPNCVPTCLPSGDICIPGHGPTSEVLIGVEVKKIDDLLKSLATGRLGYTQIPRMLDDYYQSWLLTVGQYWPRADGALQVQGRRSSYVYKFGGRALPYGYLEAFLVELQTIGVKLKQVNTNEDAAKWIGVTERWWSKQWSEHKGMRKFDNSVTNRLALMPDRDPEVEKRALVLKGLPNVGWERAWAAAEHFETLIDAMIAEEGEWAEVKGIGKVLAKTIVRTINGNR